MRERQSHTYLFKDDGRVVKGSEESNFGELDVVCMFNHDVGKRVGKPVGARRLEK